MNKDILLIILLIAIIIFALFYLINNNNKENNILESFSQQNSLSTYYQQTVDANERDSDYANNKFNKYIATTNINTKYWDGNWLLTTTPSALYFSFLQVNDQIVINISKTLYNSNNTTSLNMSTGDNKQCYPDTFVGIASLNKSGKYFILNKIICNTLNIDVNVTDKKLFGYINLELAEATTIITAARASATVARTAATTARTEARTALGIAQRKRAEATARRAVAIAATGSSTAASTAAAATAAETAARTAATTAATAETAATTAETAAATAETAVTAAVTAATGYASLSIKSKDINTYEYSNSPLLSIKKNTNFIYDTTSSYLFLSSYINPIPLYNNEYTANTDVCDNSSFNIGSNTYTKNQLKNCYIEDIAGIPIKGEIGANTYGTGCSKSSEVITGTSSNGTTYNKCSSKPTETCLINMPTSTTNSTPIKVSGYTNCTTIFDIDRKFMSNLNHGLYDTYNENYGICSYLNKFSNKTFNSAIIMYVSDLTNVQTLNYEYFGQGADKSNLTMQTDIATNFMGKILNTLRGYIKNTGQTDAQLKDALSLTNCFESSDSSEIYSTISNNCKNSTNTTFNDSILNNVIPSEYKNNNPPIKPLIWNLNIDNINSSSCTFSLSSSNLYKKENQWVKYAEFNPSKNKTNISLYKGGINQSIILENASIVAENNLSETGKYILLSGNLKTSDPKKYLIPSNVKSGFFNNSSTINLQNNVNNTGKWVILGFNLAYNSDLIGSYKKESDLITTLKAIQANM